MIVPRAEYNPYYITKDKSWSHDFGQTSLWTVFDGNLGEHFSFSFANHWFNYYESFDDTKALYKNTWRTDECNWVDWANISVHFGQFSITLGKDYIHLGTFENDAYDFDSHGIMNSMLWNNYQVYQWGGSVNWTSNDESTKLMLQMTTEQIMEKPFASKNLGDYVYSLFGSHETEEGLVLMGSFGHYPSIGWMGALGVQLPVAEVLTVEGDGYMAKNYTAASVKLTATLGDHFDLYAKGGFDTGENEALEVLKSSVYCGVGGYWFPLRNRDLRVHALCVYDTLGYALSICAGVTYALNLKLF